MLGVCHTVSKPKKYHPGTRSQPTDTKGNLAIDLQGSQRGPQWCAELQTSLKCFAEALLLSLLMDTHAVKDDDSDVNPS